jgi:hypothetical protein
MRRSCLADAAHAGQHIGLGDAPRSERVPERAHDGLLADQLGEDLGPVFAGKDTIALRIAPGGVRRETGQARFGRRVLASRAKGKPDLAVRVGGRS